MTASASPSDTVRAMSNQHYGQADRTLGDFIRVEVTNEVRGMHEGLALSDDAGKLDEMRQRDPEMYKLAMAYQSSAHNKHFDAIESAYKEYAKYHRMVGMASLKDPKNKGLQDALDAAAGVLKALSSATIRWKNAETALYR